MKHQLVICLLLIAALFCNNCGSKIQLKCGISAASQIGIDHLQPLIDAMEQYKKDNGKYPANFNLVPKYIDKIPIIISGDESSYDQSKFNILKNGQLGGSSRVSSEDGSYFSMQFLTKDDRTCLLGGENNMCEYSSDKPFWNCQQK